MPEILYEVKRSKVFLVLFWVLSLIAEAVFGGISIFCIVSIVEKNYKNFKDPVSQLCGDVFLFCFCFILFVVILVLCLYLTRETIKQVDIYSTDRMYHKIGDKVLYEIEYCNIVSVKQGNFALFLFCDKGFVKKGIDLNRVIKPQTTYMEYYSRKDMLKIIEIISAYKSQNNPL